jgi:hypothetical protein
MDTRVLHGLYKCSPTKMRSSLSERKALAIVGEPDVHAAALAPLPDQTSHRHDPYKRYVQMLANCWDTVLDQDAVPIATAEGVQRPPTHITS